MCSARVGSNPILVVLLFKLCFVIYFNMRFDDNSRRSYTILKTNVWNTEKKHWNFLIFQISSTRHVLRLKSFLQTWFTRLTCYTGSPRTENEACEPTGQYWGDSSSLRCTRRVPQGETYFYSPRVSYFCFCYFCHFLSISFYRAFFYCSRMELIQA